MRKDTGSWVGIPIPMESGSLLTSPKETSTCGHRPPAVADTVLEELLKARHKRTDTYHIVAVPQLMLPRWRRLFNKACDFSFEVPVGSNHWPHSMFEPLWIGVLLPFVHHRPWSLKRSPVLLDMRGKLRRLLSSGEGDGRHILRKLLLLPRRLASMQDGMARILLQMPGAGDLPDASVGGRGRKSLAQRRKEDQGSE